jgi:hypothetical protein
MRYKVLTVSTGKRNMASEFYSRIYVEHKFWFCCCSIFASECFLIRLVGGGVHLGALGTAATDWPIVPAPGDYYDG